MVTSRGRTVISRLCSMPSVASSSNWLSRSMSSRPRPSQSPHQQPHLRHVPSRLRPSPSSTSSHFRMSSHSVPIRHASTRSRPQSLFEAHPDLPPFKPPPIRTRLRPLIPFFIYWCIVTSLAVHLLRARISAREAATKSSAQISVLEGLIERYRAGEKVTEGEVRRELEMVGLRERQLDVGERSEVGREVGWMEAIFGRRKGNVEDSRGEELVAAAAAEEILGESVGEKKKREEEARQEKQELEEWARVVTEATQVAPAPASSSSRTQERSGIARRAPSSSAYL